MRKISFDKYDKKRKLARIDLLKIRDSLSKKASYGLRSREDEKRFLLYKLAKEKKLRMLKKIEDRKYRFL